MSQTAIKTVIAILAALALAWNGAECNGATKKQRSINTVKREQNDTRKSINEATRQLDKNQKQTREGMRKLDDIDGQLKVKASEIDTIRTALTRLDDSIRSASAIMSELESNLERLKSDYMRALRKSQGLSSATGAIAFVFSARSFSEATARYRYLREFGDWRKRKMQEITIAANDVDKQRRLLGSLRGERNRSLTNLSNAERQLRLMREETDRQVNDLRQEESRLRSDVAKSRQRLKSLDSELDRMIVAQQKEEQRRREEQQRKEQKKKQQAKQSSQKKTNQAAPGKQNSKTAQNKGNARNDNKSSAQSAIPAPAKTERKPASSSFESRKGTLPYPASGSHSIVRGFGRQKHKDENVYTDNSGIDIAVSKGATARCIFDGVVSGVFSQAGYDKVVMVRHGNYISVYANLSGVSVRNGEKVKAGQTIGTIGRDVNFDNRYVLHFELRNERTRLDPTQWLKR